MCVVVLYQPRSQLVGRWWAGAELVGCWLVVLLLLVRVSVRLGRCRSVKEARSFAGVEPGSSCRLSRTAYVVRHVPVFLRAQASLYSRSKTIHLLCFVSFPGAAI